MGREATITPGKCRHSFFSFKVSVVAFRTWLKENVLLATKLTNHLVAICFIEVIDNYSFYVKRSRELKKSSTYITLCIDDDRHTCRENDLHVNFSTKL